MARVTRMGGLLLAVVLAGSLLLSSCSTPASSPAADGTPSGAGKPAAETKPYGSLTIAASFQNGTTDPQISSVTTFRTIGAIIFDSLVELTPNGAVRPGIAERWEISADGLSHTFYIRKGVKFHDGSDLTSEDVKFSLDRMMAPEATHIDSPIWRGQVASVELKDGYTVVLRFKQPQWDLMRGFDLGGTTAVVPKKYIDEKGVDYFRKNPMGSGPWKVVKYEPTVRLELEAVENHWRVLPKFKNLTLLPVTEEATKVAMFKTGELDIAQVAPDSVTGLKAAGLRIVNHDNGAQAAATVFYDLDNPQKNALGDVRVRRALSLALNRQELLGSILGGNGQPAAMYGVRTGASFYDPSVLKPDPYDTEQAKKLLAEAGYSNGFETRVLDRGKGATLESTISLGLSGYWRKVGVTAQIVALDYPVIVSMFNPKLKPEIWNSLLTGIAGGGFLEFEKPVTYYHSTKGMLHNINNPKIDELLDKIPQTKDPAEKKRMALEAATLITKEYSVIPVVYVNEIFALSSKVGEFTPTKGLEAYANAYELITHPK